MIIEHCYIMHREQDVKRNDNVIDILDNTPCKHNIVVEPLNPDNLDEKELIAMWTKKVKKPCVSHYWTFINIFEDIVKNKKDNVIIYEDDTVVTSDFNFDIDYSKWYINLNTSIHQYKKGNIKKKISDSEFEKDKDNCMRVFHNANAIILPCWDNTKKHLEYLKKYRQDKNNKFRLMDIEVDKMINKYQLHNHYDMLIREDFKQNKHYGSLLGNVIEKRDLYEEHRSL